MTHAELQVSAEEFIRKVAARDTRRIGALTEYEIKTASQRIARAFRFLCEDRH